MHVEQDRKQSVYYEYIKSTSVVPPPVRAVVITAKYDGVTNQFHYVAYDVVYYQIDIFDVYKYEFDGELDFPESRDPTEMVKNGSGAIVNVASVNAFFQPDAATIDYGAAKAALVNLTKTLAQEFGPRGIRVNAVSPGPVSTDLWLGEHGVAATVAKATGVYAETARQTIIAGIGGFATGRFTTPEEVATLITFLASDRAGNVTGANYLIDGGLIKTT